MTGFFCLGDTEGRFFCSLDFLGFAGIGYDNDSTEIIGDDISAAERISHIDRLYFFAEILCGTDEGNFEIVRKWEDFQRAKGIKNCFIYSDFGELICNGRFYKYIFLERLSGGNPVLRNELTRMVLKYKMKERALSGAEENVHSYIEESPDEARENGFISADALSFSIQDYRYSCEYDSISVEVEMRNRNNIIGYYTMIFDSGNGVVTDDIFYEPF